MTDENCQCLQWAWRNEYLGKGLAHHPRCNGANKITPITGIIDELRRAAERDRASGAIDHRCSRCNDSEWEFVEGKGARKCDYTADD